MTEFNIGEQRADYIFQADKIYLNSTRKDYAGLGMKALVSHDYSSARANLTAAAEADPGNFLIQYRLALALLDGRRPHMHPAATIKDVERRLTMVMDQLAEAKVLLVLVAEDYHLAWKNNNDVPRALVDLVNSIAPLRAREIIEHVPAEQSRVWRLLAARSRRAY